MLLQRIITAGILLPSVILSILLLPTEIIQLLTALALLFAGFEWCSINQFNTKERIIFYLSLFLVVLIVKFEYILEKHIYIVAGIWWLLGLVLLFIYPKGKNILKNKISSILIGLLMLLPCWFAMNWLHGHNSYGPIWLLYLFSIVWMSDIAAFFAGKIFGRTKLAPSISPKKTWQGVYGAFFSSALLGYLFHIFLLSSYKLSHILLISFVTTAFAIIGDLIESIFKRIMNVKDSGTILPGHGGMLDRLDSLLCAAPVFVLLLYYLYS